MTDKNLNITPLQNSISRLEEALEVYRNDPSDTLILNGLIRRFEFTYEVSHKMLKRYLEWASPTPEQYDNVDFQTFISKRKKKRNFFWGGGGGGGELRV